MSVKICLTPFFNDMSNNKRLERDLQNRVLGGVCSGLGNYFGTDPTIWRVLFFLLFFLGCSGLLIYIILWIAMPEKKWQPGATVEEATVTDSSNADGKSQHGSWTAGLILIGIGTIALIGRYVPQFNWHTVWPIILIVIGIVLIIPKNKKS